jgi:hypothetical protein
VYPVSFACSVLLLGAMYSPDFYTLKVHIAYGIMPELDYYFEIQMKKKCGFCIEGITNVYAHMDPFVQIYASTQAHQSPCCNDCSCPLLKTYDFLSHYIHMLLWKPPFADCQDYVYICTLSKPFDCL